MQCQTIFIFNYYFIFVGMLTCASTCRMNLPMSIKDQLKDAQSALTPSERKIVRELLSNYPSAAMTTASRLAKRAGVSDPTVARLVAKLGFDSYGAFQEALLGEVEATLNSPLSMFGERTPQAGEQSYLARFLQASAQTLTTADSGIMDSDFDQAVALLADAKLKVHFLGGRFSRFLAGLFHRHLLLLRAGSHMLPADSAERIDMAADFGARDLLVVYDYRRYQADVVTFAAEAAARKARIILFTDKWKSPIADWATITFTAPVDTISPFDTMIPALAQTEALIAALAGQLGETSRQRLETVETLRARFQSASRGDADQELPIGNFEDPNA